MKIVQSYWSVHDEGFSNSRKLSIHDLTFAISTTLSVLKLREFYSDVEFYTDTRGKEFFIDFLGLPYTKVYTCLDDLTKKYQNITNIWALGKIFTYSLMTEPFIHIDNDVFIWKKFPQKIEKAPLIAQSYELNEFNNGWHKKNLYRDISGLLYIPDFMKSLINKEDDGSQYNAGIFGGNDLNFWQRYTNEVFKFIDKNIEVINNLMTSGTFSSTFEQYLFTALTKYGEAKVETLFSYPKTVEDNFSRIVKLYDRYDYKYIHLLGKTKKDYATISLLSEILWREYPNYYDKIMKLYARN